MLHSLFCELFKLSCALHKECSMSIYKYECLLFNELHRTKTSAHFVRLVRFEGKRNIAYQVIVDYGETLGTASCVVRV